MRRDGCRADQAPIAATRNGAPAVLAPSPRSYETWVAYPTRDDGRTLTWTAEGPRLGVLLASEVEMLKRLGVFGASCPHLGLYELLRGRKVGKPRTRKSPAQAQEAANDA